jgi:hypothetical protein
MERIGLETKGASDETDSGLEKHDKQIEPKGQPKDAAHFFAVVWGEIVTMLVVVLRHYWRFPKKIL